MNEQEMQFANPDWQPSQGLAELSPEQEPAIPQPVNAARLGWSSEERQADVFDAPYVQGYQVQEQLRTLPPEYQQTPVYQGGMVAPQRRSRRGWLWLLAAFLLIWLIFSMAYGPMGRHSNSFSFTKPVAHLQTYGYDMTHISTVKINAPGSSIHIHGANSATGPKSLIQAQSDNGASDQLNFVQDKDGTLTIQTNNAANGDGVQLDITLPQNIALDLTGAEIEVNDMSGQVNLHSDSSITLNNDTIGTINGQSTISAQQGDIDVFNSSFSGIYTIACDNGSINLRQVSLSGKGTIQAQGDANIHMDGILNPQGAYSFVSDSGDIDLELPDTTAMQLNIDPGSGSSTNSFPTTGTGNGPQAQVTLKTGSGSITVNKNSN